MKRFISTILAFLMLFSVLACTTAYADDGSSQDGVVDNRKKKSTSATDNTSAAAEFSEEDFEVNVHFYQPEYSSPRYYITVTNNSQATVQVKGELTAKDKYGNPLDMESLRIRALGPGETQISYCSFYGTSDIQDVDISLTYQMEDYYYPVVGDFEVSKVLNNNNVTIVVTNNGALNAQYVEAYALFFDESGNVIDVASEYVCDNHSVLKPGKTLAAQLNTEFDTYDHAEVYFSGKSDGSDSSGISELLMSNFSVVEYPFVSGDTTYWCMAIKNKTDKDAGVFLNAIAYDKDGYIVGADSTYIDVIGAFQTSICHFTFNYVDDIDRIEYMISADTDIRYKDILHSLSYKKTVNNKNVILTITNTGSKDAEFTKAYVLFFDEDGDLVECTNTYFGDENSKIKSGASITKEISSYKEFETVEIYLVAQAAD